MNYSIHRSKLQVGTSFGLFPRIPLNHLVAADDSGDESEEEEERRDEDRNEEEEAEDSEDLDSPVGERAPSPEQEVVLSASNSHQDHLGPSEEEDAEFTKELSKMVTDTSAESRKVDKKTALALWDSATLPPVARKRRADDHQEQINGHDGGIGTMAFTLITKRGNKQNVRLRNSLWNWY
jgi:regulator of nonsense transcripts 2